MNNEKSYWQVNSGFRWGICFLACFISVQGLWAQNIDDFRGKTFELQELLFALSDAYTFDFSFASGSPKSKSLVSISADCHSLRDILDEVQAKTGMKYTWKGEHIYFSAEANREMSHEIYGLVKNAATGYRLKGVDIRERITGERLQTNDQGYFRFTLNNPSITLDLELQAEGFEPKRLRVKVDRDRELVIFLHALDGNGSKFDGSLLRLEPRRARAQFADAAPLAATVEVDTAPRFRKDPLMRIWPLPALSLDSIMKRRPLQTGILPGIGWPGESASNEVNGLALFLLAGWSGSTNGLAIAGLAHVNRFNMKGAQVSGTANYNGGTTSGLQVAGLYNRSCLSFNGMQVAGLVNRDDGFAKGLQAAGLANWNKGAVIGLQAAGLLNVAGENFKGMQVSGLYGRIMGSLDGLQVAGLMAETGAVSGVQIALINRSGRLRGWQIGLVNLADSVSEGIQLGLYNRSVSGIAMVKAGTDETGFAQLQLRTGDKRLFTLMGGGVKERNGAFWWNLEFGLGTSLYHREKLGVYTMLSVRAMNENNWSHAWNTLLRMELEARAGLYKGLSLHFGPSLSAYIPHENLYGFSAFPERNEIARFEGRGHTSLMWPGFSVGLGLGF